MITLILKGGLGNQMFQYAFGKALAIERKEDLILNTTFLDTRLPVKDFTPRRYELDLFDILDAKQQTFTNQFLEEKIGYLSLRFKNSLNRNYIQEGPDPYLFDEEIYKKALSAKDPVIEGYFNNYRYFEKYSKEIINIFDINKLYDQKFDEMEKKVTASDSVSINIRRGDYLNSKHKDIFVHLDQNYYKNAIDIIRKKIKKPLFFVFSYDDPMWIQKELSFDKDELVIVGPEFVGERFRTYLRLISLCKHNIISNSTFAFWGAYLNKNKEKIVISPKQWMTDYQFENPRDWNTIVNQ